MTLRTPLIATAALLGLTALAGITRAGSDSTSEAALAPTSPTLPRQQQAAPPPSAPPAPRTPRIALGERLFVSYNCGDCHGAGGSGAMAPSLQDNRWHYGGSHDEVFRSIAEGRPGGMPTWGSIISGPEMIALTDYVRSLGEGKDLTTENFTGATVERSGR